MKKTTLLLCLFVVSVMMPQVAMADGEPYAITGEGDSLTLTITTQSAGTLTTEMFSSLENKNKVKAIVLSGKFNANDLDKIKSDVFSNVKVVDMSDAYFGKNYEYSDRPNGAVSGYKWFSTAPSGGQSTVKAIVGGNLYQVTSVDSEKAWVGSSESHNAHIVYANATALENAKAGTSANTLALIPDPETSVKYKYGIAHPNYFQDVEEANIPSNTVIVEGNFKSDEAYLHWGDYPEGTYVRYYAEGNVYICYRLNEVIHSITWTEITGRTSENISYVYPEGTTLTKDNPGNYGEYAVVGGTEYVYSGPDWVLASGASTIVDWSVIKFSKWANSIETAILPPNIEADDLYKPWDGLTSQRKLTKVQSGETYADITWGSPNAKIYASSDEECKRLKDILKLEFVDGNNFSEEIQDDDYIQKVGDSNVYVVHVTKAGSLINKFNAIKDKDGAVLWFDDACVVDAEDLLKLADTNPKFYVDLYDINKTNCPDIENAISTAFATMREENKQYKGFVLPKDPVTIGTTLIMDRNEDANKKATCSEFIAYRNKTTTAAYIYSEQTNNRGNYVDRLLMLKDMLEAPAHNDEIVSNTTIYSISSNCEYKIGNESSGTITNTVYDILGTNKTIIETIDNEMVSGRVCRPKMYVLSQVYDDFSKADSVTSIARTPNVDLIQLNGKVSSKDIKAVNSFTNGTRVLDLKNADTNTCVYTNNNGTKKNMLDSLKTGDGTTISQLQYIILPADMDTMVVHSYPTNLPNLKAIISIGNTHLTAHLNEAGTLAEARKLDAESEHVESENLTKVTLRGKLNLNDIRTNGSGSVEGLHGDANNIVRMDLEKAVFYNGENVDCNQMNFATAGFNGSQLKLKNVTLPTDMRMNTIPENCFYETKSLDSICVTYNYEYIYDGAFNETGLSHITTTNGQKGIVIDNGPNTYTFSKNLKQLGTTPYKIEGQTRVESLYKDDGEPRPVARSVFPKEAGVLEIYPLATLVPKCYKNVFEYSLTFGYGGQDQTKVYSRDRYFNNGDIKKSFSVLRYPSKDVYNRRVTTGQVREDSYGRMEYLYTDTLKVYTKKDQTGAVDANGDPILWPMRTEGNRTYNQACVGALWNDWTVSYSGEMGAEINDGENGGVSQDTTHFNNSSSRRLVQRRGKNYPRTDLIEYLGWHQIVLTQATYLDAIEEYNEDKKFERNFVETMWFTFCIPFDMTYSQVVKMLGVPKSEGNVINNIVDSNGDVITANVSADVLPDIRQLKQVTRTSSNDPNTTPNTVNFILTQNLISGKTAQYLNFSNDATVGDPTNADNSGADDPVCLLGGRPYIIKAYKRQGEIIPNQNLGLYLLKRYADDFKPSSSCVNRATADSLDYFEQLYEANNTQKKKTLKFAKPYEKHKVLAVQDNPESKKLQFKDEQGNWHNYYYTMIGQFWEQPLPLYCLYMVNGGWQHYQVDRGFKWAPYKCVLMATPEKTTRLTENGNTTGDGGFRIDSTTVYNGKIYNGKKLSVYPQATKGDLLPADKDFRLGFVGRNDYDFESAQNNARYIFTMDDDIIELDEDGNQMTAIDVLDGDVQLSAVRSKKVYSISGKYMGTTTKGLPKGIYIVGGRKIVID